VNEAQASRKRALRLLRLPRVAGPLPYRDARSLARLDERTSFARTCAKRPRCRPAKDRRQVIVQGEDLGAPAASASVIVIVISTSQRGSAVSTPPPAPHAHRHELHEAAMVGVVCASSCRRWWAVVGDGSGRAAFPRLEGVHVTGHAGRHHPGRDGARFEKRAVDARARRVHVAADAGGAHAVHISRRGGQRNAREQADYRPVGDGAASERCTLDRRQSRTAIPGQYLETFVSSIRPVTAKITRSQILVTRSRSSNCGSPRGVRRPGDRRRSWIMKLSSSRKILS